MKKFVSTLFALTFVLSLACGKGKEASKEEEGEDDVTTTATAAAEGTGGTAAPAAAAPAAAAPAANPDAATLTGTVKLEGAVPKMAAIQMSADPYCQSQHSTPALEPDIVASATGELANVFVYVENISGSYPAPATPVVLDQHGCQYSPHVNAVMVGQAVAIRNDDDTLHNVHGMPATNSQFNVGQPVKMTTDHKFDKVEMTPFKIKCDVHGWMRSYMAVMPHPFYAVSAENGTFTIPNLPPGKYSIVAWHEKLGQQKQEITVGAKESKAISFSFKG
jgi:plastocyanin